jgi:hypothetical protein
VNENVYIFLILAGLHLTIMSMISFALHFFVALRSVPVTRAAWTSGGALLAMTIMTYGFDGFGEVLDEQALAINLSASLSSLIIFLFWWSEFRRAWIADPDNLAAGVTLA